MKKVIAIGGMPATGKSTLMKKFMEVTDDWKVVEPVKLVNALYSEKLNLFVLGKYEEGEKFGGTDRYSMAVQPAAAEFFTETLEDGAKVVYEGDRIFNSKMLNLLNDDPTIDLEIIMLQVEEDEMHDRHVQREDTQSETFIKGRRTKYANISGSFYLMEVTSDFRNDSYEDQNRILDHMSTFLGVGLEADTSA